VQQRDPFYAWLLTVKNDSFVDFNPEIALEMAWILRIQSVTRSALRIIVVENALEGLAFENATQSQIAGRTKFDRPREHLQDDLRTVVQYSTRALISRVLKTYVTLQGDARSIYDWLRIPEFNKLIDIGRIIDVHGKSFPSGISDLNRIAVMKARRSFEGVVEQLGYYIRFVVNSAWDSPTFDQARYIDQATINGSRQFYSQKDGFQDTDRIIDGMTHVQTLLTRRFWTNLDAQAAEMDVLMRYGINFVAFNENLGMLVDIFPALRQHYTHQESRFFFDQIVFHSQVSGAFILLKEEWVWGDRELDLSHTRHLALGLTSAEFKFLPEWAGGNDDGTGGVFDDTDLPDAVLGPAGPGPVYHTGETVGTETSTIAPSSPTETVSDSVSMTLGNSIVPAVTEDSATADHEDADYSLVDFSQVGETEDGWVLPNINTQ
jgi:hypothetical protein